MLMTLAMPAGFETEDDPRPVTAPVRVKVRSADELRTAVRHSRLQALTLDGTAMSHILRLDAVRGLLEVQAATTWLELARYLAGRKMPIEAFAAAPDLPPTIGESVALAAPGPDGLPVTAHVHGITMVMPDGELRRADREANTELLRAALGGHGMIGVVYSLTLAIGSLRDSAADASPAVALDPPGAPAAPALECSIQTLVPPAVLEAYLGDVRALVEERRLTLIAISVRRYRKDSSALLGWAKEEWAGVQVRFGIRGTLGASVTATEVRRALIGAALARGGSFFLRDVPDVTRTQLDARYPAIATFLRDKRRADPGARLQSRWYTDLLAKMRVERCEIRWEKREERLRT